MPMMPPMPGAFGWSGKKGDRKEEWNDFKSNAENYWDQMRDMQSSAIDASREQWNRFFGQMMDIEETFAASLPDEVPTLPWLPDFFKPAISPRAFMGKVKEFQEMANEHAVEQADSVLDFCKKGQAQVKAAMTEAVKDVEEKIEKAEEEAEAKAEENVEAKAEENTEAPAEECNN